MKNRKHEKSTSGIELKRFDFIKGSSGKQEMPPVREQLLLRRKHTDSNRYGQFEIDSKQESKIKEEEEFMEQKAIELSCAMGTSVEYARHAIMEAMREHSPEEKARYKKELEERS